MTHYQKQLIFFSWLNAFNSPCLNYTIYNFKYALLKLGFLNFYSFFWKNYCQYESIASLDNFLIPYCFNCNILMYSILKVNFATSETLTLQSAPTLWEVTEWPHLHRARLQPNTQSRQHLILVLLRSAAPTTQTLSRWAVHWNRRDEKKSTERQFRYDLVDIRGRQISNQIFNGSNMMTNTDIKEGVATGTNQVCKLFA